jgi:hypothetical protein
MKEDLHYEASFYGPINSLLTHVFPLQQRFMVKPQPKLHPVAGMPSPHSEAKSSGRVSINSMNNVVQSRQAGRISTDEPDFIVVKAGFEYRGDLALAVIEVKKKWGGAYSVGLGSGSVIPAQHFAQETCT